MNFLALGMSRGIFFLSANLNTVSDVHVKIHKSIKMFRRRCTNKVCGKMDGQIFKTDILPPMKKKCTL